MGDRSGQLEEICVIETGGIRVDFVPGNLRPARLFEIGLGMIYDI